jgi:CHASE3 domain sensor protein
MFGNIKIIAFGALGLGMLFAVYLGYRHYTKLIDARNVAEQTNTVLQTALDIESATVRELSNAAGDWRDDRARLLVHIEEMQEAADEAEREKKHLRELFAEMDWSSAAADSVAGAITDRLFGQITSATERGSDRGGAPDTSAVADPEGD